MKKRIAILVTILCSAAVLAAIFLATCSVSNIKKNYEHISDYRYVALRLTNEQYTLDVISGVRETPYELDGKCAENKTEYTVFTIKPASDFDATDVTLSVTIGETEYELKPAKHPFKESYSVEIAAALEEGTVELPVTLCGETVTATAPITEGIDGEKALAVALDAVGGVQKDWGDYEIYLRLSENTVTAAGGWYWYVAFVHGENTDSVLINAANGEISAIRH